MDSEPLYLFSWRVGRSLGRSVYAQTGSAPTDHDIFIGIFDSADIARLVVESHNRERS